MFHQIGAGALGPVFRAYEPDHDRLVAIKLFRIDLPPERVHQLVAEFERLIAAGLTHPGIAAPLAAGIEGNAPYLVQEFVSADSLDVLVRDYGPAPPADALQVAVQLAGALDFAAVVDAMHGALHPRDVLISSDESRLTGLGITRALERVGVAAPIRRPYTAPERIGGASWDQRADIFSLAAMLHEILWGRRVQGTGRQAVEVLAELPGAHLPALRDALARALAENPADRFGTALEFAAALKEAFPELQPKLRTADSGPTLDSRPTPDSGLSTDDCRLSTVTPARLDPAEIEIRAADEARFADVAPPIARPQAALDVALTRAPAGLLDLHGSNGGASALERSRSAMWPLALAWIVGLALGFAAGYGAGSRDRAAVPIARAAPTPAVAEATPGGREFTDAPVSEPPKSEGARSVPGQPDAKPDLKTSPEPKPEPPPIAPAPRPDGTVGVEAGRLLVRSTPAGARVFVDGRDRGRTPATVRDLARGAHRVRIVHEGYATEERRVVVSGSRPAQSITVPLARTRAEPVARSAESFAGSLSVDSRPPGAKVFVDGKLVGTTPALLPEIGAGEHVVRLEHEGYRNWSSSVRVVSGERNRVTASLEK